MDAITLQLILIFALLLTLLFMGVPLALALGGTGIIGIMVLKSPVYVLSMGFTIWEILCSWSLIAIVGFVLMGALFSEFGFGTDIYDFISKWIGRIPGGAVISTLVMSALFGFICASAMAGISTLGKLAVPEMERLKIDRKLYSGAFAFGGTLSAIIPPSIWMIIYCNLSEASLGHMFFAGIIPGFLMVGIASVYIWIRVAMKPVLAPKPLESFSMKEKTMSLVNLLPVVLTFIVVLGGILFGFFSAIEASAIGTLMAFVCIFLFKKPSMKAFEASLFSTFKICVMIYFIMVGAIIFSHLMFLSGLKEYIVRLIMGLGVSPFWVYVIILAIITVMGCLMDVLALLIICVPIFLPVVQSLGISPILFGIVMIIQSEIAEVTPPVGLNLYILKGVLPKGTTLGLIAISSIPYVVIAWLVYILLWNWPSIALWLPSLIRN
jgi:C4-dicarboxylate transporter DctM subunit